MDIYFAGGSTLGPNTPPGQFLIKEHGGILCSQLNDRKPIETWLNFLKENPKEYIKFFIDSGSFSAWTKGREIDVDKYINLINDNHPYFTLYAAVDCIPGKREATAPTQEEVLLSTEKTWQNYLYMRSKVIDKDKLLFTFHVGEPWDALKRALEFKDENGPIKYMAFGGLVGKPKPVQIPFIRECFKIIKHSSNPNIKTHAFGLTSTPVMEQFEFTSVDSTRVVRDSITGQIFIEGKTRVLSEVRVNLNSNMINKNSAVQSELKKKCADQGFDVDELLTNEKLRLLFNVKNMHDMAHSVEYKGNSLHKTTLF